MQQFLENHLNPKTERFVVIALISVVEIVIIAFLDSALNVWNDGIGGYTTIYSKYGSYGSGLALQIVNGVFFFVGILALIPLSHFEFPHKRWALLGNIIFLGLGLFLGLIGMGICGSVISDLLDQANSNFINYPVAFWFIQLMIFIVFLLYEYILYRQIAPIKVGANQSVNPPPQQQQQIQYYAQPNPAYKQQAINIPVQQGQQLNSYPQ